MKNTQGLFWGLLLVLVGTSVLLNIFFKINLIRFLIAIFFIFIGIIILVGKLNMFTVKEDRNNVIFGERVINIDPKYGEEFNLVFGRTEYDLTNIGLITHRKKVKFNTIFGNTTIKINKDTPLYIKANSVFGRATLPNDSSVAFGSLDYKNSDIINRLDMEVNVVFGNMSVYLI